MREIKFRAWNKTLEVMHLNIHKYDSLPEKLARPDEYHIMQYTGLKDKNVVEIYEGDIIKHFYEEFFSDGKAVGYIDWDQNDACFKVEYNTGSRAIPDIDIDFEEFEVIGNIYQDSHLLEN